MIQIADRQTVFMERARSRVADFQRLQAAGLICKDGDFFPSVHYPPITMYQPITQEELFAGYSVPEDGLLDIYAHIPFCRQRCIFCHYPVQLGERSAEKDQYLDALEKEMDIYMNVLGLQQIKARSVLVGGGTPSYLALDQIDRFLNSFVQRVDLSACRQFNYDVDPVTLIGAEGTERLRLMKSYGVNRLTIGVQSLNPSTLKLMNRHHGVEEALASIENAKSMGYQVNIEFIFGYPGQTLENWIEVIEQAVKLDVDEIQLYRLKIEAYGDFQGPIKRMTERQPDELPTVEETLMMKQLAIEILNENGYHENLRRVFTKERKQYSHYAHNQCCMLYDQVGFGLTAFSSLRDRFALNTQDFDEYYSKIAEGKLPLNRGILRTPEEQMRWAIVLPLKNRTVRKANYEKQTGVSLNKVFRNKIEKLKAFGLITEDEKEIGVTKLGAFFADEVAQQFHHPDYMPYPRDAYNHGLLYPYDDCEP
ncbi:coproporphyrinogen-III oxidase family protein [Calothrix sp. 336/3]|uniref:coproporphyrinogen-III oxidase family protein n=1 Tax=Calothrix sp. 336/3 TaxID=1337936 RepID=UPI0004E33D23|nr:coproporphyrinogen-III oxidase family protein [Calothrix sp. 336/3]AKG22937.1 radical SAM protein [Calothrix sp. 336/3]